VRVQKLDAHSDFSQALGQFRFWLKRSQTAATFRERLLLQSEATAALNHAQMIVETHLTRISASLENASSSGDGSADFPDAEPLSPEANTSSDSVPSWSQHKSRQDRR
jgi:hypothetical protein